MQENVTTAIGTPNIALVKYWGKRDDALNLPTNSSVSITLDEALNTKTSILFSDRLNQDTLYINGDIHKLDAKNPDQKVAYISKVVSHMKQLANSKSHALIVSNNSFPTSSGLASSASGAATLVFGMSHALGLGLSVKEMSKIARQISGSSCRGLIGGFAKWNAGNEKDGSDSYAEQVADEKHWPEVIDLIAVMTSAKKRVSSSEGHNLTIKTSELYKQRPAIAERNVQAICQAIHKRDFNSLAEIVMRDSNNMHATMLDTYPPIMYLSDKSREAIYAIHELNESEGTNVAAYTFDAGSNAQIITLRKNAAKVIGALEGVIDSEKIISAGQGTGLRLLGYDDSLIDESSLSPKI